MALLSGFLLARESTVPRDDGNPKIGFVIQHSLFGGPLSGVKSPGCGGTSFT
jgi:hypothetical protein